MEVSDHNTTLTNQKEISQVLSNHVYNNMTLLWPLIWFLIISLGLSTNFLIILTFLRMGLDDSITVSFFVLAVSDFLHLSVPLVCVVSYVMMYIEGVTSTVFTFQPSLLNLFTINLGVAFNTFVTCIITYLAVQRCLCIVKPLHFKDMFTNARTLTLLAILGIISSAPVFVFGFGYSSKYTIDPATNRTRYIIHVNEVYYSLNYAMQIYFFFIFISSNLLVPGSIVVMAYALKASVRFRNQISKGNSKIQERNVDPSGKDENPQKKDDSKERMAIMQVALLCVLFMITNIPKTILAICNVILSTHGPNSDAYGNLLWLFVNLRVTFDYINSAINFPIYYKYNTKFRNTLRKKGSNLK